MDFIKVLPHAPEAEQAVISSLLIDIRYFDDVNELIPSGDYFHNQDYGLIFDCMIAISQSGKIPDVITIAEEANKTRQISTLGGWVMYLVSLTEEVPNLGNLRAFTEIVVEKYKRRELITALKRNLALSYDELTEVDEITANLDGTFTKINDNGNDADITHVAQPVTELIDNVERLRGGEITSTGIMSGIHGFDELTKGFQNTDLIILAARPSQGKTALAIEFVLSAISQGHGVYFVSLEMGKHQLTQRALANLSGLPLEKIKTGNLNPYEMERLHQSGIKLANMPLYIDDRAGSTINQIYLRAKRLKRKGKINMVVLDYLQLTYIADAKNKNREQQIAELSRMCKLTAKDLNIPFIALSQMNRSIEQAKRKPQMSDLRESGAIEQDADMVIFIHHDSGNTQLVVAKNRNGRCDDVDVAFIGETQKWIDRDEVGKQEYKPFSPAINNAFNNSKFDWGNEL